MSVDVRDLSRDTYRELVTESPRPVVIDFWGPQCAPCLALEPVFLGLADQYSGRLEFLRVEAPKNRMLCVDTRVMSLPTFLFFREGAEVSRLGGDVSPDELTRWVKEQVEDTKGGEAIGG